MDLNINSPVYYTKQFGVDDEIYKMCMDIRNCVKNKEYSEQIKIIGIVPIIAPSDVLEKGSFKEMKKCENKAGFASVRLRIDFELYMNADFDGKKSLIVKNVLDSVKSVANRGKINYKEFEKDIHEFAIKSGIKII